MTTGAGARARARASTRRSRPALDREAVLRVGVELLNRDGIEAVTFRKIAEVLSVTPMALYRHVQDKSNLLEGLLDRIVRDAAVIDHDEPDWCDWTCETYRRMVDAMLAQRGVLALVSRVGSFGPTTAPVVEEILARLLEAGFSESKASVLLLDLNRYMLGTVVFDGAYWPEPEVSDREPMMRAGFEALSEARFPHLTKNAAVLASTFSGRDLELGIRRLLASHEVSRA